MEGHDILSFLQMFQLDEVFNSQCPLNQNLIKAMHYISSTNLSLLDFKTTIAQYLLLAFVEESDTCLPISSLLSSLNNIEQRYWLAHMLSILDTSINSLAMVMCVIELCACKLQLSLNVNLYQSLNLEPKKFHVGKKETLFSANLIILNCCGDVYVLVGKVDIKLKQKRVSWSHEEERVLTHIIQQNTTLSTRQISNIFGTTCPLSLHDSSSICQKIYRLKAKLHNTLHESLPIPSHCTPNSPLPHHVKGKTSIDAYLKTIHDTPIHPCMSCARLMFAKQLRKHLVAPSLEDIFLDDGNKRNNYEKICTSCKTARKKNTVSPFSTLASHGLNAPIPNVSSLNDIEERLVSVRIPFAQIRQLAFDGQLGLRGTIVNVMADLDRVQCVLPRFFDTEGSIVVGIKRKLAYDHSYKIGAVRPLQTMQALNDLLSTSLYITNNVSMNGQWMKHIASLRQSGTHFSPETGVELQQDDEEPYSDYLIHGLYSSQQIVDHDDSTTNVAPSEGFAPLSIFKDTFCEELSFPRLFYGEQRKYHELALKSYQTTAKWELTQRDRRFALNIENLFFKTMKIMVGKVLSSIWVRLRKGKLKSSSLNARAVLQDTNIEQILHSKIGYRDFDALRTSPDFKEGLKKNLFAMIRQLGSPTFFVTLSCAERLWRELIVCLEALNPIAKAETETEAAYERRLIRSDPITCARYYVHRFQALKSLLKKNPDILGSLEDYFFVTEFQNRGSQHDHGLLWIKDAPVLDKSTDQDIVAFVDKHISTDSEKLPEHLRVPQTHHHKKTCKKNNKGCRFGFPRPPMHHTMLLRPFSHSSKDIHPSIEIKKKLKQAFKILPSSLELSFVTWLEDLGVAESEYVAFLRSTISTPTLFLRREPRDANTNNFNIQLSALWNANTDLQFVLNAHGAAAYCTSYMTKMDSTLTKAIKDQFQWCVENNATTIDRLRKIGNSILNAQQLSSQQAAYIVLSLPLTSATREFSFVNTAPAEERTLLLKRRQALQQLQQESTDIFFPDSIQKYTRRPAHLWDICLGDFVTRYNISGAKCRERKKPCVLRYIHYNKTKDPDNHFREECLLFLPFKTSELDNLKDYVCWHDVHEANFEIINTNRKKFNNTPFSVRNNEISELTPSTSTSSMNPESTQDSKELYDIGIDICIDKNKKKYAFNLSKTYVFMPNPTFYSQLQKLNAQQRLIFDDIMLRKRLQPNKPLNLFLTGGAGTGKTFTLLLLVQGLLRHYARHIDDASDSPTALLMAYTGKAAFNIGGTTIHSALHLPLMTNNSTSLSSEKLDTLSTQYRNLRLVVFYEISLVGSKTFALADSRLRCIKHVHDKPFGGLDVILCGDLFQASPVRDSWIFKPQTQLLEAITPGYWQTTPKCYELETTMRQRDPAFIMILNRIRTGAQTQIDLDYLNESFHRSPPSNNHIAHLYYTNKDKNNHNERVYNETLGEPHILLAVDKRHRNCSKKIQIPQEPQSTAGLLHLLQLKPLMSVELCAGNHDIADGLVNGAEGTFMASKMNTVNPFLWIQFSLPIIGHKTRCESQHLYTPDIPDTWTPLHRIAKEFQIGKNPMNLVTRKQFPIQPSAARTIHRSQGLTMESLAFNPKKIHTHGLVYTALSRVRDPANLFLLEQVEKKHINVDDSVRQESKRLHNEAKWHCLQKQLETAKESHIIVQSLNTVSFKRHHDNIVSDSSLMSAHILCLQETRLQLTDQLSLRNFCTITSNGAHGIAICYKPILKLQSTNTKEKENIELLYAHFVENNVKSIHVVTLYKSPTSSSHTLMLMLNEALQQIPVHDITILIGDFNIDALAKKAEYTNLQSFLTARNFTQQIMLPTSIYNSAIDHIWTKNTNANTTFGTNHCYWSDHSVIYMLLPN